MGREDGVSFAHARALAALSLVALAGCSHVIARGKIADFFAKDFELPDYRSDQDSLSREMHRILPSAAAATAGDGAGWVAGAYPDLWPSAPSAAGDFGGAGSGHALSHAAHEDPLPEAYPAIELALPIIAVDPNSGV